MTLRQNVALWDRWLRCTVGVVMVLGLPLAIRGPWWLTILGAFGGAQIITAINGY